jgi:hypothetical protein
MKIITGKVFLKIKMEAREQWISLAPGIFRLSRNEMFSFFIFFLNFKIVLKKK